MTIPQDPTARDKYFIDKINNGEFEHDWLPIKSSYNNHNAIFYVSASSIKVDGVRITVSAKTQQIIADILNASLPTCKSMDLRQRQADISIVPLPRPITNSTNDLIDQSKKIDRELIRFYSKVPLFGKIVSNTGKSWVLSNHLRIDVAYNYGWFSDTQKFQGINCYPSASISNLFVIQPKAGAHNALHQDYSQEAIFLRGSAVVDNNLLTLTDVLTDPDFAPLISEEGVLNVLRQP